MSKGRSTPGDRVRQLLTSLWRGSQIDMARSVGCSQAALSNVANSKTEPGKRLLAVIAAHPEVNPEWLHSGHGQPTRPKRSRPDKPNLIPVLSKPCNHDALASANPNDWYPAPPNFDSTSCYWAELQVSDPIVADPKTGMIPRDLLLIDSDRDMLPDLIEFAETLCVVRLMTSQDTIQFGRVTYHGGDEEGDPAGLEVETFETTVRPEDIIVETIVRKSGNQLTVHERKLKKLQRHGRNRVVELDPNRDFGPLSQPVGLDDILGIARMLVRRL